MRIRSQLLLVAAVVFVPGFIAAVVAVEKVREGERQAALRGLRETVRATALLVDGQVQRSLGSLTVLAQSEHLKTGNFAGFYEEALASNQPPNVWTLLLDDRGVQLLNTAVPFGTPLPMTTAPGRVAGILAKNRLFVTDLIRGPVTGQMVTTMYLPTKTMQGRRYVIAQAFSVDHWKQTVLLPVQRAEWLVAVIDRNGRFVFRSKASNERLGQQARPELVAAAAAAHGGLIRHATLEGVESYDAFTHSELTGWTVAVAAPVNSIEASATQAVTLLTIGGLLALTAAILAALYLGRIFIGVIDAASQAARHIGSGDEPKLKRSSLHEVNALFQTLIDAGHLLATEKTARTSAEAQRTLLLEQETTLKETAQRQNAAKDQFLALLGHELRNPLAAISGATEVLDRSRSVSAPNERFLMIIRRQTAHLRHIVDDLLEVSRMLSGKIVLEPISLDLAECVRNCVEAIRASGRALEYQLIFEGQEVWVRGDPVRIEQIVSNLVANSLKFSNGGSVVRVRVRAVEDTAILEVTDQGIGIPADLMPHIFDPFVQGPSTPGRMAAGLGIGLSLVKQLVELHGGAIEAQSDGTDRGATLRMTLPQVGSSTVEALEPGRRTEKPRRILFVEDNPDAMEAMTGILQMMGHEVVQARSGGEAMAVAQAQAFDVALMDIGLPDMSGYELATEFRQMRSMLGVRLIALTGYGLASDRVRALSAGFDAHLAKPVDAEQLARAMEIGS
jgi:signal transduction histidine kinase/CheY-like chemotaxis protein